MSYRNKMTNQRFLYVCHKGMLVSYMTKHIGSSAPSVLNQCHHIEHKLKSIAPTAVSISSIQSHFITK